MTADVKKVIQKIYNYNLFECELYFVGGTALSFYLEHRISEDIDIVSSKMLPYEKIAPTITSLGAKKFQDENVTALRMAGLFLDEYLDALIFGVILHLLSSYSQISIFWSNMKFILLYYLYK